MAGLLYILSLVLSVQSLVIPEVVLAAPTAISFLVPTSNGGSFLNDAGGGFGEPLNVIISGASSPEVLTDDGFVNFARSVDMSTECLGFHLGAPQSANLGDGNGWVNQTMELRQDFGNSEVGTCVETLTGGNHLRMYRQNGTEANTGALFLAVSKEEDLEESHTIVPDGYNIGRDLFAAAATGTTEFDGVHYSTTAQNITGLVAAGSDGVNHGIAIDGIITLLTITITSQ